MIRVCPTCQQKYPEDTEFCAQDGTRLEEMQNDTGDPLLGRVLDGRWEIEERIGEGGMGAVYRASQRSVDRQVAIKTLRPELCNSREFVDRFFREARVASNIAHPHCVTILDFGQTDDGTLFLAMEFLDGMPLTNRLRHPDLTIREIIEICIQISSALAAAHGNNVIHRDLKPDNVFLLSISDGSTFTKVLDFGIAKVTDSEEKMTQTGQVFGTPEYMSPEQCRGDKLDGRSDLYSLGCILYRMLGGRPPFESDTPMAVLVSHVSETPRHVREFIERDDVPNELTDLCMRLLSKNADGRPDDAQAVRAELEVMLGHTSTGGAQVVANPSGTLATSDEHISGETLATDSAKLVNDGGSTEHPPVTNQQSEQNQPPNADDAPDSAPQQAAQQQGAHRTDAPSGHTTSPAAVSAPQQKSVVPLILGVGVAVILAASCAIGTLYVGYTHFFAEDGESIDFATLFQSEDDQPADDQSTDDEQVSADETDNENSGDEDSADENSDNKKLAGVEESDSGQPSDGQSTHDKSDAASKAVAANDKPTGAKADDSDKTQGGKQTGDGSSAGDDDEKTAAKDDEDSSDDDQKTTNIQINADRAEIAVNTKENNKGDVDSNDSDSDNSDDAVANNTSDTNDDKKEAPSESPGSIRQSKLSTTGSACIKPNVESVLRQGRSKFLSCYSSKLDAQPDMSGKVMLAWNISTDGAILAPEVLVSDVKDLNSCLLGKLKRLRFDAPIGGRCYVRATYRFSP